MKQFRPASVASAGLLALALAGCSGTSPEPSESPATTSAAPTSSAPASPTPKPATSTSPAENLEPPEMPELATEFSIFGYESFVEYWFEAQNYALATGDVEPMMEVSQEGCGYCLKRKQIADEVYEQGDWILGGEQKPTDFLTDLVEYEGETYHGQFSLNQREGDVRTGEGEVNESYKITPGDFKYEIFSTYDEHDGWRAVYIDLVENK